jgi:UDP-N-acetylmuramyl pentapeptide synthase
MKPQGILSFTLALVIASSSYASELTFQFSSPSFSGQGYSSHVLTIEQLEANRRQKIKDEQDAAKAKAELAARNSNLQKFLVNLESRIYAQLSKQMADAMFGESGATSGSLDFQGTNITWVKTGTDVTLTIIQEAGGRTEITVPVASFRF